MLNMSELSPLILTIAVFLGGVVSGFSGLLFQPSQASFCFIS